jgi:hypothetical protein
MDAFALSLRSLAAHERDHKGHRELASLIEMAADDIERLRTSLKEIIDCWYLEDDSVGTAITKAENLLERR